MYIAFDLIAMRPVFSYLLLLLPCLVWGCAPVVDDGASRTFVPAAPDYALSELWYTASVDTAQADVFYIPSTWEYDWTTSEGLVCHYADVYSTRHRDHMRIEMQQVAAYMGQGRSFYSPFYRHITLDSWATLSEDTIRRRYEAVAEPDIQAAFDYYLTHYNGGRPFILAGFSQGGKAVVSLLRDMPEEVRRRLIAAYVMGYKVTPDDRAQAPWIRPAQDSCDIGVTICYNSVSDPRYTKAVVSLPNTMAINPVNWRTDATPAVLHDTLTVTLDTVCRVLVVEGFDASKLPNILDILNVGDLHGVEYWLYADPIGRNMGLRTRTFLQAAE